MVPANIWFWGGFIAFVLAMLALDLGVFHRRPHVVGMKEAGIWTAIWVALALTFAAGLYFVVNRHAALTFLTGYVIEESLSADNIFVMVLIFEYFRVPKSSQHRVLFYGILGALVMRGVVHRGRVRADHEVPLDSVPLRRLARGDGRAHGDEPRRRVRRRERSDRAHGASRTAAHASRTTMRASR